MISELNQPARIASLEFVAHAGLQPRWLRIDEEMSAFAKATA
jgi:hypothetical protein